MSSPQTITTVTQHVRTSGRERVMLVICGLLLVASTVLAFVRYSITVENSSPAIKPPVFDPDKPLPAAISTKGLTNDYDFAAGIIDPLVIIALVVSIICFTIVALYARRARVWKNPDEQRTLLYLAPLVCSLVLVLPVAPISLSVMAMGSGFLQSGSQDAIEANVADWAQQRYGVELAYSTQLEHDDSRTYGDGMLILPEHPDATITLDDGRKVMFEVNHRSNAPDVVDAEIILVEVGNTELPVITE